MEATPKERVIYDDWAYYGEQAEDWTIHELMERDNLASEDEVRENYTDDEIFEEQMDMRNFDFEFEMASLTAFFDGKKSDQSEFINPYGGNHILVSGSVERWDGTSSGINVYESFDDAIDCSPSRFQGGNVFADCEIDKVWDENGTLFVTGHHHDGGVQVEMRQLTDAGERLFSQLDYGEYLPLEGLSAMGKTYALGDEGTFISDLYNDPALCVRPRYMEQSFGCPALEYEHDRHALTADRREDGTYAVLHMHDGMVIGGGHLAESLADAKAYCEEFICKYLGQAMDTQEKAYDLASEKKEALPAKDALAENGKDLAQEAPQVNDNR